jgi:hypothetical protein
MEAAGAFARSVTTKQREDPVLASNGGGRPKNSPTLGAADRVRPEIRKVRLYRAQVARNAANDSEGLDKYGLPWRGPSLLSPEEEHLQAEALAAAFIREAIKAVKRVVGPQIAKRLFSEALKEAKTQGPKPGPRNPNADDCLVVEWDRRALHLTASDRKRVARQMAGEIASGSTDWGRQVRENWEWAVNDGQAANTEQRIRRALRRRDENEAAARLKQRVLKQGSPPTLLE